MITAINLSDEEELSRLWYLQHASYKVEAQLIGFDAIPPLMDTLETLRECGEQFIGYEREGELAGALAYSEAGDVATLCRMMVHPEHFRQGIAGQLIKAFEERTDCSVLEVSTGALNEPAIQLYRKYEYSEVGSREVAPDVWITLFSKPRRVDRVQSSAE
ncbi:hypothetical protein SY83_00840 [Paenibacillus swuensis]|uniref:N-acetyltransferase domain-containing protein n=1 Tax=Paenibacillus swuensis TaxID=1178515 RepID=A0A172TDX0_9BACL|nr:GNAT family N-acetyltransferase [Paenibacillus swuensis]ANE45124.1 hypothetical protein SY83_00840 [Paenibacillus swuensis]